MKPSPALPGLAAWRRRAALLLLVMLGTSPGCESVGMKTFGASSTTWDLRDSLAHPPEKLEEPCNPETWLEGPRRRNLPTSDRLEEVLARVRPRLKAELERQGFCLGAPVYFRIFKEEHLLEAWLEVNGSYHLFRTWPVCTWSGALGPKTKEGDLQAPEGLYQVAAGQLNPRSGFHLSFNLGYPNAYERRQGWTGSALMVHGACVSVGCFAMTDEGIEEIYVLLHNALERSQDKVPVHAFPFRMTAENLERHRDHPARGHWKLLLPAYTAFESERRRLQAL